ncbi:hypothetical protein BY458DRAFT_411206, partial [Sporodiniella umbellata]
GVGMNDSLIDSNGYPRNDIDVATIRITRNQINCLKNDYYKITAQTEESLFLLHALKKQENEDKVPSQTNMKTETTTQVVGLKPFALVNAVAPDSPAYEAGLRRQQKIIQFGSFNDTNYTGLTALNAFVSQHENKPVEVHVLSEEHKVFVLTLVPRIGWGGKGSLGCHLLPL